MRDRERRAARALPSAEVEGLLSDRAEMIAVAELAGLNPGGAPRVRFARGGAELTARSLVQLGPELVGRELAVMFENGDRARPVVLGRLERFAPEPAPGAESPTTDVEIDGETVTLAGEREVVLRCGRASITLTRDGRILLHGEYISSRSAGVNRIKGGSVQIN